MVSLVTRLYSEETKHGTSKSERIEWILLSNFFSLLHKSAHYGEL